MDILLGIDAGTSNIKAVLATPDGGVLATAQAAYSTHHPKPGWAEQSPEDWWHGLVKVVKDVIGGGAPRRDRHQRSRLRGHTC
jgi:xylulokinase